MRKLVHRHRNLNGGKHTIAAFKIDAGCSAHPEGAVQSREDCIDDAVRDTFASAITLEMAPVVTVEAILRPDPKVTSAILGHGCDVQVAEPFGVGTEAVTLRHAGGRCNAKQRKA